MMKGNGYSMKFLTYATLIAVLIIILSGGYIGYLALFPRKAIVFKYDKIPVRVKEVYQGDVLPIEIDFIKFVSGSTKIERKFINTAIFNIPPITVYRYAGSYHFIGREVVVPLHLPPGTYYLQTDYTIHVNWLRSEHKTILSEQFIVKERPETANVPKENQEMIKHLLKRFDRLEEKIK